jgi:hypothetical protein
MREKGRIQIHMVNAKIQHLKVIKSVTSYLEER